MAYGNGKFVAGINQMESTGSSFIYHGKMAYSVDDGLTWTEVSIPLFENRKINAITYGNGKFVVVGSGGKMAYSKDGISWTEFSESPFGTTLITSVNYCGGKFMAGGASSKMAYSNIQE